MREFVNILYLHREHSREEMEQAIQVALNHYCAHLDGVQLWLTQLKRPEPILTPLDLVDHPRLNGIGEQTVQARTYDLLVGGTR